MSGSQPSNHVSRLRAGASALLGGALLLLPPCLVYVVGFVIAPRVVPDLSESGRFLVGMAAVCVLAVPVIWAILQHHKRTSLGIQEHEHIQWALTEIDTDLLYHMDDEGRPTWCGPSFTRVTGWTLEELQRTSWRDRVHPDDLPRIEIARQRCLTERCPGEMVCRSRRRDGSYVWIEVMIVPITHASGASGGFVARARDISKFVALHEELQEQRDRLSIAQRAARIGVWESTAVGEVMWSEVMYELHGVPFGTRMTQERVASQVMPEDLQRLAEAYDRTVLHGVDLQITIRVRHTSGDIRHMAITGTSRRHGSDGTAVVSGTCMDVTEQVRQREQLKRSEATLLAFVEYAPAAVAMFDRSNRCVLSTRRWTEIFPTTGASPINQTLEEILPQASTQWSDAWAQALAGTPVHRDEDRFRRPDGSECWLRSEILPWVDGDGGIGGVIVLTEDVAPRKAAEAQLRAATAVLEEAQSIAHVGSWSLDLRRGQAQCSRELYQLFDRDESLGPPDQSWIAEILEPESAARFNAAVTRAIDEGKSFELIVRTRKSMKGGRVMKARGKAIVGDDGRTVVGLVGMIADMTDEAEREAELRRAREAADRGNRAKSEFLASMSHEIRTPMTAILGYAELLMADESVRTDPVRGRSAAEIIRSNGKHLLAIINDILDLSKIEAGKLEIVHSPVSPRAIVTSVVTLLGPTAQGKGLSIEVSSNLDDRQLFLIDPTRFHQILVNLVGNAVKFTSHGSVRIDLEQGPKPAPGSTSQLLVRVSDTGIGLSEEQISRVFGAFEQADASTTRRYGGTGLGLRISRRLAELMDGTLSVTSAPGEGSVFVLALPAVPTVSIPTLAAAR